jgi:ferredoxin
MILARTLIANAAPGPQGKESSAMSYQIIASQCTSCGACEFECPNAAIRQKKDTYVINPKKCTECVGFFDTPQCAVVCPVPDTCVPLVAEA